VPATRASTGAARPRELGIALGLLAVAAGLRLAAASRDLWLDEIWTLHFLSQLDSVGDVFVEFRHNNNHILQSLWMQAVGPAAGALWLRLPAVLAGVASVALAAALGLRRGREEALAAGLGVAGCYLMVHYTSEARGYALAMAFALGALLCLPERPGPGRSGRVAGFAACVILGLLAHASFVYAYGAIALWWIWAEVRARRGWSEFLGDALRWHAVPGGAGLLIVALLASLFPGGGPKRDTLQVLASTFGYVLGTPVAGPLSFAGAALGTGLLLGGLLWLARRGDDRWVLYAGAIVIVPAAVILAEGRSFLVPRYFLMSALFFLLLAAELLGALARSGAKGRVVFAAALAAFWIGNLSHLATLWEQREAQYARVLALLARETQGPLIRVGSRRDHPNQMLMRFFAGRLPEGKRLAWQPTQAWPESGPEWLVLRDFGRPETLAATVTDPAGRRYELVETVSRVPLSGAHVAVYRNRAAPGG